MSLTHAPVPPEKKSKLLIIWAVLGPILGYFFSMYQSELKEKLDIKLHLAASLYYQIEDGKGLRCWNDGSRVAEDVTFDVRWKTPGARPEMAVPRQSELEGLSFTTSSVNGKIKRILPKGKYERGDSRTVAEEFRVNGKNNFQHVSIAYKGDRLATEIPWVQPKDAGAEIPPKSKKDDGAVIR